MRCANALWGVVALLVGAVSGSAGAQLDDRSRFEEGNRLYREADYEGALTQYLSILESGRESGTLYYNIGNCYFKLGNLGRSILNYERALRLMPRDADTRANLDLARSLTADDITPLPTFWLLRFFDWSTRLLPHRTLMWLVAVSYLGTMTGLVIRLLARSPRVERWGIRMALGVGLACVVFALNLAVVEFGIGTPVQGIILHTEVSVQSAPSDDRSLQLFSLHEGTKVRIDQRSGDWAEIVLADGKVGWVKADAFEVI